MRFIIKTNRKNPKRGKKSAVHSEYGSGGVPSFWGNSGYPRMADGTTCLQGKQTHQPQRQLTEKGNMPCPQEDQLLGYITRQPCPCNTGTSRTQKAECGEIGSSPASNVSMHLYCNLQNLTIANTWRDTKTHTCKHQKQPQLTEERDGCIRITLTMNNILGGIGDHFKNWKQKLQVLK